MTKNGPEKLNGHRSRKLRCQQPVLKPCPPKSPGFSGGCGLVGCSAGYSKTSSTRDNRLLVDQQLLQFLKPVENERQRRVF
jgi:hypothetical protein